eukprot:TRINITY_DN1789_c0_g1_i1.p1 TRINITY_DN1789_c0_g1~~TRINITY_DN1789_c0_g1_i1.p1  ORF type:complete len:337 (-),score=77.52 TRINITY_DN1789_c0_g1_i1:299-1309(-)
MFILEHPFWSLLLLGIVVAIIRRWTKPSLRDVIAKKLPNAVLQNGMKVYATTQEEADTLYRELFENPCYLQKGVAVHDGDVIFDVGANIGFFSLFLVSNYQKLKLYTYEPIPDLHAVAELNVRSHQRDNDVHMFNDGLSDRSQSSILFDYDAESSIRSSMCASQVESAYRNAPCREWVEAIIKDGIRMKGISASAGHFLLAWLRTPLLRYLLLAILSGALFVSEVIRKLRTKKVSCSLKKTSDAIDEIQRVEKLDRIDLMKIDVEGAEMDVLRGIHPKQFNIIRQLVIEVHDIKGRVQEMQKFLESYGFRVTVDQEDWAIHRLMNIYTIYAIRPFK